MALVLRLENRAASTTVDLLGTDDVYIMSDSWKQGTPYDGKVTETFRILARDTSIANVIADVKAIEDLLEAAFDWHSDPLESSSTWLRFAANGETAKRALVYDYLLTPVMSGSFGRELVVNTAVGFDLVVTRHRFWEDVSATQETHASNLSVWGGTWDLTGTITGGRVDGRISALRVTVPAATNMSKLWVGIRDDTGSGGGAKDLYNWSIPSGNASQGTGEAGETGSGHILVDFSAHGTGMDFRIYEGISDVGRWIVLLRYKLGGGSSGTVGVRASSNMYYGPPTSDVSMTQLSTQYVSSTTWDIVELGELQLPASGKRGALGDAISTYTANIAIEAERIDGDHDLYLDSICLIPADRHLIAEGEVYTEGGIGYWLAVTYENDAVEAYSARNQPPIIINNRLAARGIDTWRYPHEGGYFVFAAQQDSGAHDATDTIAPRIDVYKRWITYHD